MPDFSSRSSCSGQQILLENLHCGVKLDELLSVFDVCAEIQNCDLVICGL